MSKKCADCGCEVNPNVIQGMYYCPRCDDDKTERDVLPLTVFDKITESEEVLAEKFVYQTIEFFYDDNHKKIPNNTYYVSTLLVSEKTGGKIYFETKEHAIAATVAELKKEYKENVNR